MILNSLKRSKYILNVRNWLNIRPVPVILPNDKQSYSISDAFCWRKNKDFDTNFRYTDLINYFTNVKDTPIKLIICNHKNKILKNTYISSKQLSNSLCIRDQIQNSKEMSGHFFIFHTLKASNNETFLLRNSCYTGFSFKGNMQSVVHGNLPTLAQDKYSNLYKKNIVQYSKFKNYVYKIQHNFLSYDKVEAFIFNPCKEFLKVNINQLSLFIEPHNSIIIDLPLSDIYKIKSKCLLLRPIFFVYKNNNFDAFHG